MLLALRLLNESFPREIARRLEVQLNGVQQALRGLQVDGLVAARLAGRTRLYRLNPRYFARQELEDYLKRLAGAETELVERTAHLLPKAVQTHLIGALLLLLVELGPSGVQPVDLGLKIAEFREALLQHAGVRGD